MLTLVMNTCGLACKSFAFAKFLLFRFLLLAVCGWMLCQVAQLEASELPVISIKAKTDSVEEGEYAMFFISSSSPLSDNLPVKLVVRGDDMNVIHNPEYSVTIHSNSDGTTFQIPTHDDRGINLRGNIEAELLPSNQYTVMESKGVAVVSIEDNDQ